MSFYIMVFSGPKAMDGLARSCSNYVSCVSAIFRVLSFIAAPTHLHPRPQCRKISCLPRLPHHLIFVDLLEDGHSEGYALMHRCSFDGRFSNWCWASFICSMAIWMPSEDKGLFRSLACFSIDCFFDIEMNELFACFWRWIPCFYGEGNDNPLQCSCLDNPRDRGAWWAAVCGSHRVGQEWSDLAAAASRF